MCSLKRDIKSIITKLDIAAYNLFCDTKGYELKVIICGLPRSGTSFLTGLVERMGFNVGPKRWLKDNDKNNKLGYFECLPLNLLSEKIMDKYSADFISNLTLPKYWLESAALSYGQKIKNIINSGRIDLYKDNRLLVIADLYVHLYPNAKWIFIQRSKSSTYKSRFGDIMSEEQWRVVTEKRLAAWRHTAASSKALHLNYEDFSKMLPKQIEIISGFLNAKLSNYQIADCKAFFQPKTGN